MKDLKKYFFYYLRICVFSADSVELALLGNSYGNFLQKNGVELICCYLFAGFKVTNLSVDISIRTEALTNQFLAHITPVPGCLLKQFSPPDSSEPLFFYLSTTSNESRIFLIWKEFASLNSIHVIICILLKFQTLSVFV